MRINESCDLKPATAAALQALTGLPLANVSRAANMLMFGFGGPRTIPARQGGTREVTEFALHVQCPWRLCDSERVLIGSVDIYYPADLPESDPVPDSFNWDIAGANRCDRFFQSFMAVRAVVPIFVTTVDTDQFGGFRLNFSASFQIEAFPNGGTPSEEWRLFKPGEKEHFVMEGSPSVGTQLR